MKTRPFLIALLLLTLVTFVHISQAQTAKSPLEFFGFEPGSYGNLFDYNQLIAYFRQLDNASPRIQMREIGESPMGKKMYMVFISSPKNPVSYTHLDVYKRQGFSSIMR